MRADPRIEQVEEAEQLLGELETIEQKLSQLHEGLSRSHRLAMLGTMASTLAHEYNNILTPVISYCQMAHQSPDDTRLMRKAVDRALSGARRAAQISESVLGLTRQRSEPARAEVAPAIEEALCCMVRPPQKDGIELALRAEGGIWVAMGPTELQQVLLNLILNARRAMGRRGGRLSIEASRPHVGSVRIEVQDTGSGIAQDLLPRIFDPFVTRCAEDAAAPGTGLGLAICRDLVHRAHGRIEVARTGPEGTVMRLDLPEITR